MEIDFRRIWFSKRKKNKLLSLKMDGFKEVNVRWYKKFFENRARMDFKSNKKNRMKEIRFNFRRKYYKRRTRKLLWRRNWEHILNRKWKATNWWVKWVSTRKQGLRMNESCFLFWSWIRYEWLRWGSKLRSI